MKPSFYAAGAAVMFTYRSKIKKDKSIYNYKRQNSYVPTTTTPTLQPTENDDEQGLDEDMPKVSFWQVMKKNQPEWMYILFGVFCSGVFGAAMPAFSFMFGEVMQILGEPPSSARSNSVPYAIAFVVVGILAGLAIFCNVRMRFSCN